MSARRPWPRWTGSRPSTGAAARAQERQARALERLEVIRRDEARRAAQDRQNAERDSRSLRRFDRR